MTDESMIERVARAMVAEGDVARLRAELERDAADAARYRWLRRRRVVLLTTAFFGNGCVNKDGLDADAYIDDALAQEPPA